MSKLLTSEIAHAWSATLLRAAGFTLLHSLWQGALVALLTAVLLMVLHRCSARLRYQLTASALLIIAGLAAFTFGYYCLASPLATGATVAVAKSQLTVPAAPLQLLEWVPSQGAQAKVETLLARSSYYLDQHLPLLLWAWLLGVLAMSLRFAAGLNHVRRLRRYRVEQLPTHWQAKVDSLARRAGFRRSVQVLTSALVTSPLVVGHFKPLILVPLGAMAGLAAAEIEMIFAHEIAHIVRKDYLVNLLQAVVEIVFFYHPAIWFLSASLRIERENCCDDIAAQLGGGSLRLARALSSLAEWAYAAQPPRLAVAVSGPRGSLLNRVQRLLHLRAGAPSSLESAGVAGIVLGAASIIVISTLLSLRVVAKPLASLSLSHPVGAPRLASATKGSAPTLLPRRQPTQPGKQALYDPRILFENQLFSDKLIASREQYAYTLTTQEFSVNGQLQPRSVADRYHRLYATATGKALGASESFQTAKKSQRTSTPVAASRPFTPPRPRVATTAVSPPATTTTPPSTQAVAEALRQDGLLAPGVKAFELVLDHDGLRVNGQAQPAQLTEKYRTLLHAPLDPAGQTHTAITIRVTD